MILKPGLSQEIEIIVQVGDTAAAFCEALPPVLSTPYLVSLLENAAMQAIRPFLADGQSSVGTRVNIQHMAATPVGMQVRIRAELLSVEGRRVLFKVDAWDEVEKIAEGEHERYIIDVARFTASFEKKMGIKGKNHG
ncbi:MAG: hypothetical protein BGO78_05070 [Chloroflexi bacterium 44-23]|nr:MAG: hypothetical protein BGO78_05070 [Chloroflexi bacterium 44-23]